MPSGTRVAGSTEGTAGRERAHRVAAHLHAAETSL